MSRVVVMMSLMAAFSGSAQAQSYTVGIWPAAAASTSATPVNTLNYAATVVRCGQPQVADPGTITNPTEGHFNDPTNTSLDCIVDVTTQVAGLATNASFKGAIRTGTSAYSPFSNTFMMQTVVNPCDGTPATSGTVVEGTRTVNWCWDGKDTKGNVTMPTSWVIYVDGVKSTFTGVTNNNLPNATGQKLYSASVTLTPGVHQLQIDAVNAVGEAQLGATFVVTVTALPAPPTTSVIRSVQ